MKTILIRGIYLALSLLIVSLNGYSQSAGNKVIRLYEGVAPGSENWDWQESAFGPFFKDITTPTLTTYLPEKPNGIAMIVAPGGAFHFLAFDAEGTNFAKSLNEKGITVFVLKYRLVHEDPSKPYLMEMIQKGDAAMMDSVSAPVVPLATQDGLKAIKYVRDHAKEYNIDPNKIGIQGSSAGGTIAMNVTLSAVEENRPNFTVVNYGYEHSILKSKTPTFNTPLFICATSDDSAVPIQCSLNFYNKWIVAKQPVEMHIYQKGEHGFVGGKPQNIPVDSWVDTLSEWLFMLYPQAK